MWLIPFFFCQYQAILCSVLIASFWLHHWHYFGVYQRRVNLNLFDFYDIDWNMFHGSHSEVEHLNFVGLIKFFYTRILDNLPVAVPRQRRDGSQTPSYEHGFRVGYKVIPYYEYLLFGPFGNLKLYAWAAN